MHRKMLRLYKNIVFYWHRYNHLLQFKALKNKNNLNINLWHTWPHHINVYFIFLQVICHLVYKNSGNMKWIQCMDTIIISLRKLSCPVLAFLVVTWVSVKKADLIQQTERISVERNWTHPANSSTFYDNWHDKPPAASPYM